MCASNSPPVISCQIGAATKYQFQQPDECPVAVCSALAMYEQELDRHRDTEAQLRKSVRRKRNLLRQKNELILQKDILRGPRIIATDRQAPRIYPQMIRLCSRFDSVLFTPKMSEIPSYGNYSRSP
jgi:hypothetical protein